MHMVLIRIAFVYLESGLYLACVVILCYYWERLGQLKRRGSLTTVAAGNKT